MALLLSLDVSVMCYRNANLIISSSLKKKNILVTYKFVSNPGIYEQCGSL